MPDQHAFSRVQAVSSSVVSGDPSRVHRRSVTVLKTSNSFQQQASRANNTLSNTQLLQQASIQFPVEMVSSSSLPQPSFQHRKSHSESEIPSKVGNHSIFASTSIAGVSNMVNVGDNNSGNGFNRDNNDNSSSEGLPPMARRNSAVSTSDRQSVSLVAVLFAPSEIWCCP